MVQLSQDLKITFLNQLELLAASISWEEGLAEAACAEMQLHPKSYYIWFSDGMKDILSFLEEKYDRQMLNILYDKPQESSITKKIEQALITRICDLNESKALRAANDKYYKHPSNIVFASKIAWRTVDTIWRYAGDKSTDFNYYSKRGLLYAVYLASVRRYNIDTSSDHQNTKDFIARSLQQIVQTAKTVKQTCNLFYKLPVIRMFV